MREKKIEEHARDRMRNEKLGYALKLISLGIFGRSFPDRTMLFRGGITEFWEFKQLGKKPTKLQAACHRILTDLGFTVRMVDSIEMVDTLIDAYKARRKKLLL